ncbi:MAG TPA: aldo/keto reductase [Candidatus Saccharimonadales bacterium]|nr:aldo/keto reductase [Candidatus Saccharimonadales bacterium]
MPVSRINLSADGPEVSRIAFGAWRLADVRLAGKAILDLVQTCLESGITTVDHADIYGGYQCQRLFGEALAGHRTLRDQLQLITKCGIKLVSPRRPENRSHSYDTGRAHILASVETSLQEVATDRFDLLLIHRPDPFMDPDEVAAAFVALKKDGKVLHFGVSNFMPGQFDLLASRLPFPLVTNQLQFSVLSSSPLYDGTFDQCQQRRILPMAWSPMAGGQLFRSPEPAAQRVRTALRLVAEEIGAASPEQVALAWILAHPAKIVPVLGTCQASRLRLLAAAETLKISREQWFAILAASTGAEVP